MKCRQQFPFIKSILRAHGARRSVFYDHSAVISVSYLYKYVSDGLQWLSYNVINIY